MSALKYIPHSNNISMDTKQLLFSMFVCLLYLSYFGLDMQGIPHSPAQAINRHRAHEAFDSVKAKCNSLEISEIQK